MTVQSTATKETGRRKRPWWAVVVAVVAGFGLGLLTGEDPWSSALGVGVVAVIVMAIVTDGRSSTPEPKASAFLRDMAARGVIDDATFQRLLEELAASGVRITPVAPQIAPPQPQTVPITEHPGTVPDEKAGAAPLEAQLIATHAATPASKPAPEARVAPAWLAPARRFWHSLASDFAVQGLGSLGVLLVFAGTLGFVLFAFTEVGSGFRPAAEIVLPAVLAGLAAFLYRQGATFVATALEFLFGLVTPVMAFAAFADGAGFPPDLERGALVVVLTTISAGLALGYLAACRRRPASPLRFLVAPLGWLAVGVLGLVFDEGISAAQMAGITASVAVTAWLVRRPRGAVAAATSRIIVPGLALAYVLTIATAFVAGWPPVPMLVAGAAVLAAVEAPAGRITMPWLSAGFVVLATALALSASFSPGWVACGALVAMVGLAERWAPTPVPDSAIAVLLGGASAAAVASFADPAALIAASGLLTMWSHLRRRRPVRNALALSTMLIAAASPIGLVIGLSGAAGEITALLLAGAGLAGGAAATRRWAPSDLFYAAWIPLAAIGVALAVSAGLPSGDGDYRHAVTLVAAAIAVVAGRLVPVGARTWLGVLLMTSAAATAAAAAAISPNVRIAALVMTGLGLVLAGAGLPGRVGGHLAASGHVLAAAALEIVVIATFAGWLTNTWFTTEGWIAVALFGWSAGWLVEVSAAARIGSPLQRLAPHARHSAVDTAQTLVLLASVPLAAGFAAAAGWPAAQPLSTAIALVSLGVAYAVAAYFCRERAALRSMLGYGAVALTGISVAVAATDVNVTIAADRWIATGLLGATVASVAITSRLLRDPWLRWLGWLASAPLTVLVALDAGVATSSSHWALFGWGVTASLTALAVDNHRNGRRHDGPLAAEPWLEAPAVLGLGATASALLVGLAVPVAEMWPAAVAGAAASALVAVVIRLGSVSTISWSLALLAIASGAAAAGRDVMEEPWLMAFPSALMLLAGLALPRSGSFARRWDLAAFIVGSAGSLTAIGLGTVVGATATTWVPIGCAAIVVGVARRLGLPTVLGAGLILGAAHVASPAWLAAALGATFAGASIGATRLPRWQQSLQWASAAAAIAGFHQTLVALPATPDQTTGGVLAVSALIAVGSAVGARWRPDPAWAQAWLGPWAGTAAVALAVAVLAVADDPTTALWWTSTAALGTWAAALGLSGVVLGSSGLRAAPAGAGLAAVAAAGAALGLGAVGWATLLSATATLATLGVLVVWSYTSRESGWVPVLGWAAAIAQVGALAPAVDALPLRAPLAIVFIAAATQALTAGIVLRRVRLLQLGPPLLFAAWATVASDALAGEIQWISSPLALAVLAVVELGRWDRVRRGLEPTTDDLRLAEVAGMALLVGPALYQTIAVSSAYGLLAILEGVALVTWGALSHVRRRAYGGVAAAGLGAALMILVPLVTLIPEIRGVALWATLLATGAALLTVAATIEQMRRGVAGIRRSVRSALEGWE